MNDNKMIIEKIYNLEYEMETIKDFTINNNVICVIKNDINIQFIDLVTH